MNNQRLPDSTPGEELRSTSGADPFEARPATRRGHPTRGVVRPAIALTLLSIVQFSALILIRSGVGSDRPDPELARETVTVPLEKSGGMPVVRVSICGEGPYRFLLDTGASGDGRIDRKLAVRLGLKVAGKAIDGDGSGRNEQRRPIVRVPTLDLGGVRFRDREFLAAPYEGRGLGVMGVLGFGLFDGLRLTLDQPRLRVQIQDASGGAVSDGALAQIPFRRPRGVPEITVRLGASPTTMLLDSGAATGLLLPSWSTETLRTVGKPRPVGKGRTFNNEFPVTAAFLAYDLCIGSVVLKSPYARFSSHLPHGLLGNEILSRYSVTFDTERDLMILR